MKKLLFFYAPWCPPCKFYEREFIDPLEKLTGVEKIQRINAQEDPFTAEKYMVDRLPAVVLLDDGTVKMNHTGAIDICGIADYLGRRDVD